MKTERLVILAVEDDPGDLVVLRRLSQDVSRWDVEVVDCASSTACISRLAQGGVDLVLLDYQLGAVTGLAVLQAIQQAGFDCPVVFLTGMGDEQLAVEALQAGAVDYLPKSALSARSFQRVVGNAVEKAGLQRLVMRHQESLERANKELQDRNREITRFYHTVSHELKTPLTSAREFASLLLDEVPGEVNELQAEYLEYVLDSCDQLTRFVNDMLDVTRVETGKLKIQAQAGDLGEVVRRTVSTLRPVASKRGLRLEHSIPADLPQAWLDEQRVMQVLSNLLTNAIKFTPDGGQVSVQVARERADDRLLGVSVADSGFGIEDSQLEAVFDRLHQTDGDCADMEEPNFRGGLGLGLSICREIVQLHGGRIHAQSTLGEGSTFHFTVPVAGIPTQLEPKDSSS
ncbi:MAG: response regulator [bacterium]|nr:response regulator [bacterium]